MGVLYDEFFTWHIYHSATSIERKWPRSGAEMENELSDLANLSDRCLPVIAATMWALASDTAEAGYIVSSEHLSSSRGKTSQSFAWVLLPLKLSNRSRKKHQMFKIFKKGGNARAKRNRKPAGRAAESHAFTFR